MTCDFPVINYDEIDKLIAQKRNSTPPSISSSIHNNVNRTRSNHDTNRKNDVDGNTTPNYISFTRQKACHVAENAQSFTKVLRVSQWTPELEEEEEENDNNVY